MMSSCTAGVVAPVAAQARARHVASCPMASLPAAAPSISRGIGRPSLVQSVSHASLSRRQSRRAQRLCVSASTAVVSAASASAPAPAEKPFKWGADMKNLGICVAVAVVVWLLPPPSGVKLQALPLRSCTERLFRP